MIIELESDLLNNIISIIKEKPAYSQYPIIIDTIMITREYCSVTFSNVCVSEKHTIIFSRNHLFD